MRVASVTLSLTLAFVLSACQKEADPVNNTDIPNTVDTTDTPETTNPGAVDDTLIGVAAEAGDFGTLLTAVDAAGLTETLQGEGPFTVFAPTDAAFEKLPAGTVEALLGDIPALTDILLYHVVDGAVPSSAVGGLSLVTTLNGVDFKVSTDGGVFINDAEVIITDIQASNGVIHVIDTVLMPPLSITAIAAADPNFSTLVAALQAADLDMTLSSGGPYTVFAPTNAAFDKLPPGTVDALLKDIPTLTDILLYHVHDGRLPAADVLASASVSTLFMTDAPVAMDGGPTIGGAAITATDIPARNGVIHVLGDVMLPK